MSTTCTDQEAYDAYIAAGGKVTKAAQALGVPRTSFSTMVARHTALLAETRLGEAEVTQHRDTIRNMLAQRYHGAVEPTEEMIDAVLNGLDEETSAGEEDGAEVTAASEPETTECLCGCGERTTRQFVKGHVGAYSQRLRAAYVDGTMTREQVLAEAAKVGDAFAGKLTRSMDNADRKTAQAAAPAKPKFQFPGGVLAPVQFHHLLVAEGTAPAGLTTQTVYGWLKTVKHQFPHRHYTADGSVYDEPQTVDGVTVTRPGVVMDEGRAWYVEKFGASA